MKALVLSQKGSFDHLQVETNFPIPRPSSTQVLIKVHAVAINPVDWKMVDLGIFIKQYPIIVGCDVSGEIVEKGDQVTHLEVGDRVFSYNPLGVPNYGTFAEYCLADGFAAQKIPEGFNYEQACTLGVGNYTAFLGLFWRDNLNLSFEHGDGKYVLVWGGSSSLGIAAIQLLAGAGYHVLTTCSPKNMQYLSRLGAHEVFDHTQENVVQQIREAGGSNLKHVFDCVGDDRAYKVLEGQDDSKIAWTAKYSVPKDLPTGVKPCFVQLGAGYFINEVITFLTQNAPQVVQKLIKEGKYEAPNLEVYHGVEQIKLALLRQKQGVSGTKVVVSI